MLAVTAALERIEALIGRLEAESVPLVRAGGRVLAAPLRADLDFPPFDTTAMDGYAIRLGEANRREREGVVGAGNAIPEPLRKGEAVRVMTGAPLPAGTEAVVPVEDVERREGAIHPASEPRAGAHVRRRGEVFRTDASLLSAGERLTPARILLCATAGADPVSAIRLPRVVLAATGNELVEASRAPHAAEIRNGNGPAISAALAARGIVAATGPALADDEASLRAFFDDAGSRADLLLTTGGVSVGDYDRTVSAAKGAGFEIIFHGVSIKPGKPVAFGRRDGCFWFGLPGNPVSALTTFHVFVEAALDAFEGARRDRFVLARLAGPITVRPGRETYRDARLFRRGAELIVEILATRGSHDILAQSGRNALAAFPAEGGSWKEGDVTRCLPLSPAIA